MSYKNRDGLGKRRIPMLVFILILSASVGLGEVLAEGKPLGLTSRETHSAPLLNALPAATQTAGKEDQANLQERAAEPLVNPGRIDARTKAEKGFHQATLNRLRAGQAVDLIVEFATPNVSASADDPETRRSLRLLKQDLLDEVRPLDVEEARDYSHLPMQVLRVRSLEALEALRRNPRVKAIYEIGVKHLNLEESLPLINQPTAYGQGATGAGATVAVLDTGVDYRRPAFGSCLSPGGSCKVVYARDFAEDDGQLDDNGHGTNVAGIVLGVAPQSRIVGLDVFRGRSASDDDIIAALNWVLANHSAYTIVAVNLSIGDSKKYTAPCNQSSYTTPFDRLKGAGIAVVVAAGNEGYLNGIEDPACAPGAVSVGAVYDANVGSIQWSSCVDSVTAPDRVTCFSNSASFLSLLAPGAMIDAAGLREGGTSQATPHVAGAFAALKSACIPATPDEMLSALQSSGKSVTDHRNGLTKPRIDLAAALQRLSNTVSCGGGGTGQADLVVTALTSPSSGTAGARISATSTVKNQGTAATQAFYLGYYLSTDRVITTGDIDTTWGCDIPALQPGESHNCRGEVGIPATVATGLYYLGAYADTKNVVAESNETNNGLAATNPISITGSGGGGQYTAEDYYRKVNAYFWGVLGCPATSDELAYWGEVLRQNNGSVWKPTGAGLQIWLADQVGWGTVPLSRSQAELRVEQVLDNLFIWSWDLDPRIAAYYVNALMSGSVKERGLVNAVLNDLAIMPKADGTYGQPATWTGGSAIRGLLTSDQFERYQILVELLEE